MTAQNQEEDNMTSIRTCKTASVEYLAVSEANPRVATVTWDDGSGTGAHIETFGTNRAASSRYHALMIQLRVQRPDFDALDEI